MQDYVGEVVAEGITRPEPIVEHVGDVLDRAVVSRKRIQEEPVSKNFQAEYWAFVEWVFADEISIIPDEAAVQSGCVDEQPHGEKKHGERERRAKRTGQQPASTLRSGGRCRVGHGAEDALAICGPAQAEGTSMGLPPLEKNQPPVPQSGRAADELSLIG